MRLRFERLHAYNIAAVMPTSDWHAALTNIHAETGWSWHELAAVLGVAPIVLASWRFKKSVPSAAAQKLIWLIDAMVNHPDRLYSWKSIASWGREGLPPKRHKSSQPPDDQPSQTSSIARGGMSGGAPGVRP